MLFTAKDIQMVKQSLEYIDTAVLLCGKVSLDREVENSVIENEYLQRIGYVLEKEYKGRMLALPIVSLPSSSDVSVASLQEWIANIKTFGFKHILFITTDMELKEKVEDDRLTSVWLPAFSLEEGIEKADKILLSQIRNIMKPMYDKWSLSE